MSQLQLHLASEGIVEDVITLIDQLTEELHVQQQEADTFHAEQRAMCASYIPSTADKRDYNMEQRDIAIQTVKDTTALTALAETNLADTIDNLFSVNARIEEGTADRER